jgi:integrase
MYLEAKEKEWTEGTRRKFTGDIGLYCLGFFGNLTIEQITANEIENWKTSLYNKEKDGGGKYKAITLNGIRRDLSALFNYAINRRYIFFNPVRAVSPFKDPSQQTTPEKEIWTPEEFQQFISVVNNVMWNIFYLVHWATGTRIGEMQGLMFKDINAADNTVKISKSIYTRKGTPYIINPTKTKKTRIVEIPETLSRKLAEYIETQKQKYGYPINFCSALKNHCQTRQ